MLKAHSKLLEHIILAGDLLVVAGCWMLAYGLRFYVIGPPLRSEIPPLGPYVLMLLPILLVWGVSFRAFDLYRPRRIASHLSEAADIAKASSMGALVLVAVMTFVFREFEYSRVVIIYFWLLSIGAVWFSRAAFREALRFARRRGYNLRYAIVVGDGDLAATVVSRMQARPDVGIQVLGVVGDDKDGASGARWLGGYSDLRAVLDAHTVDHVILALVHEDYGRLGGLLDAVGDEPVTIHVVPDLFRFASLRGGVEEFEGMPFIHLRDSPLHGWSQVTKRVFDVVFASAMLARARRRSWPCSRSASSSRLGARSSIGRSGWAWTGSASGCSSSARCGWMPRPGRARSGRARTTRGACRSAPSCAG